MNLYDKKLVKCIQCKKQLGEIDLDSKVFFPICKKCYSKNSQDRMLQIQNSQNFNFLTKRMIESEIS